MTGDFSPAEIRDLRRKHYNTTVAGIIKANSELAIMRLKPDFQFPAHKPGQYTTLGLGHWEPRIPGCADETFKPGDEKHLLRRAYSISHPMLAPEGNLSEADPNALIEFYVVLVRNLERPSPGAPSLTPRLFLLQEGDRLYMGEKVTGHYTLDPVRPEDDVLLLATGTGEAPHNYMAWHLLRGGHKGLIVSVCCTRYLQDLAYVPAHEKLMRMFSNYHYIPLTTREASNQGHKMYIQDLLTSGVLEKRMGKALDPNRTHVFLCGNPSMIGIPHVDKATGAHTYPQPTGTIEILEKRGFRINQPRTPGNIHFEKYW